MRIASYRKDTTQKGKLTEKDTHTVSLIRASVCVFLFLNHLTEKGKPIARWGRKAIGSTIEFVDSLAAEANGIICSLFLPAVPVFRLVCLIEKGERNEKIH